MNGLIDHNVGIQNQSQNDKLQRCDFFDFFLAGVGSYYDESNVSVAECYPKQSVLMMRTQ
jgi:hypothetical protein